jgi:hypothetical protein
MKIKSLLVLALAAVVFVGCATNHSGKCCQNGKCCQTTKWEYKEVTSYDLIGNKELNSLANEGWELVFTTAIPQSQKFFPVKDSVVDPKTGGTPGTVGTSPAHVQYIFKRPIQSNKQ